LDEAWPFALQLFSPLVGEEELTAAGVIPMADKVAAIWMNDVQPFLTSISLIVPDARDAGGTRAQHTEHLAVLLADMQAVARLEAPDTPW